MARFASWVFLIVVFPAGVTAAETALEIVRKSVNHDQANCERSTSYTYVVSVKFQEQDSNGAIKKTEQKANEVLFLYGEPYERLIERDGKPLPLDEAQKEQRKLDRAMEK